MGKAKSKNSQPDKALTVCKASIKGHNGTASLQTTPPSTQGTPIIGPPTELPGSYKICFV